MTKLLVAHNPSAGPDMPGWFGTLDFIRETVCGEGELLLDRPVWWTGADSHMARMACAAAESGAECDGKCGDDCPLIFACQAGLAQCRVCHHWESGNGRKGECQDPAYDGRRKRRTAHDDSCGCFFSRWISFKTANRALRRKPLESGDLWGSYAPCFPACFTDQTLDADDLAEFVEVVKRLAQRGIIEIPKAGKAVTA